VLVRILPNEWFAEAAAFVGKPFVVIYRLFKGLFRRKAKKGTGEEV
jgi:hypothetical protein